MTRKSENIKDDNVQYEMTSVHAQLRATMKSMARSYCTLLTALAMGAVACACRRVPDVDGGRVCTLDRVATTAKPRTARPRRYKYGERQSMCALAAQANAECVFVFRAGEGGAGTPIYTIWKK